MSSSRLKFFTLLFDVQPNPYVLGFAFRLHIYIAAPENRAEEKEKNVISLLEEYFLAEAKPSEGSFNYVLHSRLPPEMLRRKVEAWFRSTGPRVERIRGFAADPFKVSP